MGSPDIKIVMESNEIAATLERIAERIVSPPNDTSRLVLVGIHTGGVHLAKRIQEILSLRFHLEVPVGTLDITLYRDDWTRLHSQPVLRATNLPFRIDEMEVILVDDVLFTGRTIRAALDALIDYGRPMRVQLAVLVDRGHRELPICAQFIGIEVQTSKDERVDVLLVEKDGTDQVIVEWPLPA